MNQKPLPPERDVKELARQFRKLWVPGQGMRPYLRKHAALFQQLRQDGWSWAGLALAMTTAGVMYQTQKPWTAEGLLQAFSRAQLPLKGHARRKQVEAVKEISTKPSSETSAELLPTLVPETACQADVITPVKTVEAVPRFKPVSFRPFEPRPKPTQEELAEIERNRILTFGRS